MERDVGEEERETPGATRSQHVVLQGPADLRMMAAAMRPGLERSRSEPLGMAPACIVVTPTAEQALGAAEQARLILSDDALRVVPVSAVARARRVLALGPVAVVVGTAAELLELRRASALRLDALKAVVVIGLDDILRDGGADAMQSLLGDAPDELQRIVTLEEESPESDAFLEAHLRRARRLTPTPINDVPLPMTPSFAITSQAGRAETLRAILDAADPPSVVVVAASDAGLRDAERALTRVGVVVDGTLVQVVRQPTSQHVSLVVLWETPATLDALTDAIATRPVDAVVLLLPDELPAFRRLTNGLAEVWSPPVRKEAAESRVRTLRTALRSTLAAAGGASASEMALLAPLLDSHDALEIAAAALRLYEGARRDAIVLRAKAATAATRPTAPTRTLSMVPGTLGSASTISSSGKQRVFLAVGKRDSVRIGDVVGAVANEVGIPGERIGTVELFESHSIVELAPDDAAKAVERLGDATLRGRRLSARIDDRPMDSGRERKSFGPPRGDSPRGDRPLRGPDRADRGARGAERSTRAFDRGDRPERTPRSFDRSDSPPRPFDRAPRPLQDDDRGPRPSSPRSTGPRSAAPRSGTGRGAPRADEVRRAFGDRPVSERAEGTAEWSERAERMKHAKRDVRASEPDREPDREPER